MPQAVGIFFDFAASTLIPVTYARLFSRTGEYYGTHNVAETDSCCQRTRALERGHGRPAHQAGLMLTSPQPRSSGAEQRKTGESDEAIHAGIRGRRHGGFH